MYGSNRTHTILSNTVSSVLLISTVCRCSILFSVRPFLSPLLLYFCRNVRSYPPLSPLSLSLSLALPPLFLALVHFSWFLFSHPSELRHRHRSNPGFQRVHRHLLAERSCPLVVLGVDGPRHLPLPFNAVQERGFTIRDRERGGSSLYSCLWDTRDGCLVFRKPWRAPSS